MVELSAFQGHPARMGRIRWLDAAKAIGIILVVLGHISRDTVLVQWIYLFHMPLFFFVSGWVYKKKNVLKDIGHRARTLMVPYYVFGGVLLLYWQLFERRFRDSALSFGQSVYGLLTGEYDYLDFNVHLWFLPCLFVTAVFFNVLVNVGDRWKNGGIVFAGFVSLAMSAVSLVMVCPPLIWGFERTFQYIGFYAAGAMLSKTRVEGLAEKMGRGMQGAVLLLCLSATVALNHWNLTAGIFRYIDAFLGIFLVVAMALLLQNSALVQYLGRTTLLVLCIHGPIYRILIQVFSLMLQISTDSFRSNLFLSIFVTAATLALCALCYEICRRIVPWALGMKRQQAQTPEQGSADLRLNG